MGKPKYEREDCNMSLLKGTTDRLYFKRLFVASDMEWIARSGIGNHWRLFVSYDY
jgi:hypothetical protein